MNIKELLFVTGLLLLFRVNFIYLEVWVNVNQI